MNLSDRCTDDDLRVLAESNPDPRARSAAAELIAIRQERRIDGQPVARDAWKHKVTIERDGERRRYVCSCGKQGSWVRGDWRGDAEYGARWAFRAHVATRLGWLRRKAKMPRMGSC